MTITTPQLRALYGAALAVADPTPGNPIGGRRWWPAQIEHVMRENAGRNWHATLRAALAGVARELAEVDFAARKRAANRAGRVRR